jgi:hypothetical protein
MPAWTCAKSEDRGHAAIPQGWASSAQKSQPNMQGSHASSLGIGNKETVPWGAVHRLAVPLYMEESTLDTCSISFSLGSSASCPFIVQSSIDPRPSIPLHGQLSDSL